MKMKKLLILILSGFMTASCNNDNDDALTGGAGKNEFRVKTIHGAYAHWGDFTMCVS